MVQFKFFTTKHYLILRLNANYDRKHLFFHSLVHRISLDVAEPCRLQSCQARFSFLKESKCPNDFEESVTSFHFSKNSPSIWSIRFGKQDIYRTLLGLLGNITFFWLPCSKKMSIPRSCKRREILFQISWLFNMERVLLQPANSLLQPAKKVWI